MFYQILNTDFVSATVKVAKEFVKADRLQYKHVFQTVFQEIKNENVLVSDINLLLSNKYPRESIILYAETPFTLAKKIADVLVKKTKFVKVRNIVDNRLYEIIYDGRKLIKIYWLEKYMDLHIYDIIDFQNVGNLRVIPPEIELILIYQNLYIPNKVDEWKDLLEVEAQLSLIKTGAGISTRGAPDSIKYCCKSKRIESLICLKKKILPLLEEYVIVGDLGIKLILHKIQSATVNPIEPLIITEEDLEVIQVISENLIEEDFKKISSYLSTFTKCKLSYTKRHIYVIGDPRLNKYTIYIKYPTLDSFVEKPLLHIYDCARYDLVPYVKYKLPMDTLLKFKSDLKVGNSYVLLRFLYVDLWVLKIINHFKPVDRKKAEGAIISNITKIKKNLSVFGLNYYGKNKEYLISQKIESLKVKLPSYHPFKNTNGLKKYKRG
jgi:hypothetical protein